MEEIKRNKDYAGQVVDISRSGQRISFKDCLQKMTEKEGDPYLNVFAPQSIYLITLFQFDEKSSVVANLPLRDMPLIKMKTQCAETEIFNCQKNMEIQVGKEERDRKPANIPLAFTFLKAGNFAGKTPGDILLTADDPDKAVNELKRQMGFLKRKLSVYPANQLQMDAIEDAINSYELGILEDMKPRTMMEENELCESSKTLNTYIIYQTPIKHQKKMNPSGIKNACYSIVITCTPAKQYPYHIDIMNCYAPLKKLKNGLMPVLMEQAEDKKNDSIDLTEAEWLYIISCLDENMQNAKKLWYQEMHGNDDSRRWKGTGFREA